MRKIMVLQHVGHEPLGTLNPMLKTAGFRIRYINFGRHPGSSPSLEGYRGLIVLGGPMGVYESHRYPHLKVELGLVEDALKRNIPILGICLGAQLLAHALGANVNKGKIIEIGWLDLNLTEHGSKDPLFAAFKPSEKLFQLHQDTFEIPHGAVHLARSKIYEGQAFRYGEKAYGLQFHLEVDKPMIHRWLKIEGNRKMLADANGLYHAHEILTNTEENMPRCLHLSEQAFSEFIKIFQLPERPELLGSEHGKPR